MPIKNEWAFSAWKGLRKPLTIVVFVIVAAGVFGIGRLCGLELNKETSFVYLTILICAAVSFGITEIAERLLFGKQPTRPLAMWLKVVVTLGILVVVSLAIWDGFDARAREQSAVPKPSLIQQMREGKL